MSRYLSKYFEVFVCLHKSNRRKGSTFGNRRRSVRGLADIRGRARGKQPPQGPLDKDPCGGYNNSHRAGVVQRPVHQPSKLRTRVRLPSPAPARRKRLPLAAFFLPALAWGDRHATEKPFPGDGRPQKTETRHGAGSPFSVCSSLEPCAYLYRSTRLSKISTL